jgi:hypothetical protein
MNTSDPYEQWREARRAQRPSNELADRIMAAIEAAPPTVSLPDSRSASGRSSHRRQVALIVIAASAFLLRMAAAFAVFLTS